MSFRDKVVVITGGTAGIGRATAREFARRGAKVAVLARDPSRLQATAGELADLGAEVLALSVDVADEAAVQHAAAEVESTLGPIDFWINNAMASTFGPVTSLTTAELRRVINVTFLGAVHGTFAALHRMTPRNRGTIIQIGSTLAYRAIPLQAPYCAAKHALRAFTESLRVELRHARSKVRTTMVHLPAVNTPQFDWVRTRLAGRPRPLRPVFQPEVAARAILYAAAHAPRELSVGLPVSLGIWLNKLVPGIVDRYLSRVAFRGQEEGDGLYGHRDGNLFHPVAANVGAHGRFDGEAIERSAVVGWQTSPRIRLMAAAVAIGAVTAVVVGRRHRPTLTPV